MTLSSRAVVLVACSDDDTRRICAQWLEHSGFDVVEAANPDEVLGLARASRPDVMITSHPTYASPDMTVTALLRGSAEFAKLPVLSLASWTRQEDLAAAAADGVSESLLMPVPLPALVEAIDRHTYGVSFRPREHAELANVPEPRESGPDD
jgi:CheY-like chemotaxis protein